MPGRVSGRKQAPSQLRAVPAPNAEARRAKVVATKRPGRPAQRDEPVIMPVDVSLPAQAADGPGCKGKVGASCLLCCSVWYKDPKRPTSGICVRKLALSSRLPHGPLGFAGPTRPVLLSWSCWSVLLRWATCPGWSRFATRAYSEYLALIGPTRPTGPSRLCFALVLLGLAGLVLCAGHDCH